MYQPITIYTVTLTDKGREHVKKCMEECKVPTHMLKVYCAVVEQILSERKSHGEALIVEFSHCVNSDGKFVDFAPEECGYTIKSEVI